MLRDCNFHNSYSSGINEPKEFFTEALLESKQFDLGLGFFSSSAFRSLAYGFALFIANGGTMRIVINHILSDKDKKSIARGEQGIIDNFEEQMLNDVDKLLETLSKEDEQFFNCFSFLVQQKRLQFVATMSTKGGLGHDKYGIFTDENRDKVAFIGSANFSRNALESNAETITVFRSWKENDRIEEYEKQFSDSWSEDNSHLIHIPLERVITHIEGKFSVNDIKTLIQTGANLRDIENCIKVKNVNTKPLPQYLIDKIQFKEQEPRFPFPKERDIQINAYNAWVKNNRKGIFAMATGSGKTVTALNCVLKEYKNLNYYKAIIVVPTQALAEQWEIECQNFNFQNIVSTHTCTSWKNELDGYMNRSLLCSSKSIIIITTYATFVLKSFQSFINNTKNIENFVFIADEAHNLGSNQPLKKLPLKISKRIGLSATPERIYDDIGSKKLYDFFDSFPPKYTYRFTMKEAIESGILCKYEYYPLFVSLESDEMAQYLKITKELHKFLDPESGKYKEDATMLLMKRKRIIHKAKNKKHCIVNLLDKLSDKNNLNYTFVFVPEGYEPNYGETDSYDIQSDDQHLINQYSELFRNHCYSYHQFVGGMNDSNDILEAFSKGDIQILLSMKCLDEGVDIPRAENAIFISSTGNPRQFIQRRGRVLRKCKEKKMARIWDLVVIPPMVNDEYSSIESNLFKGEVKRILNFAALCENKLDILYGELKDICYDFGINIFEMLEQEEQQYNN